MAADSNMGFQQGLVPLSVCDHPVSSRPGAMGSFLYPLRTDCLSSPGMVFGGSYCVMNEVASVVRSRSSGNILLDATIGTKQEAASAADWMYQEQALLEEGLVRYADQPNIMKYIKVAALLPDKTARDVALRCQWMIKKENGKRRKLEDYYVGTKSNIRKDKTPDHILHVTMPSEQPGHMASYSFRMPQTKCDLFSHEAPVIDGACSQLLNENITLLCQIEANLESLKLNDNIHLLNRTRNNISAILDSLGQMPPLPGMISQMPPLPVALHEELADGLFLGPQMPQRQNLYGPLGIRQLKQEPRC